MVRTFQFSVCNVNELTEAKDINGKEILTDVIQAETMNEAIAKINSWLTTNNYRVYKAVIK